MILKIESCINIIVGIVNLYFVLLVYRLNKRETNPKISFNPKIADFSKLNRLVDINVKQNMTPEEKKEEEIVSKHLEEWYDVTLFDEEVYFGKINFDLSGFPEISHENMLWVLNIDNKGDFPAINLIVEIELVIKRVKFDTGIDSADIINPRFVDYKRISKIIKLDYLPSRYSKKIKLLKLQGDFIEADLYIKKAYSDEITYIEKLIKIDTYTHPVYLSGFKDMPHMRRCFGADEKGDNNGGWDINEL